MEGNDLDLRNARGAAARTPLFVVDVLGRDGRMRHVTRQVEGLVRENPVESTSLRRS